MFLNSQTLYADHFAQKTAVLVQNKDVTNLIKKKLSTAKNPLATNWNGIEFMAPMRKARLPVTM